MSPAQKTVMIIEDEPDAAELFAEMMRVNGFRVVKMFSSAPAIPMLTQEKPDIVILDVMMPDISGLEVLRYMRREPGLAGIPVIVVSAKSMPRDIKSGLDAGASLYLAKPVDFVDLKQAVDQVMKADRPGI
jgi:CheY-like chemotaxis protein